MADRFVDKTERIRFLILDRAVVFKQTTKEGEAAKLATASTIGAAERASHTLSLSPRLKGTQARSSAPHQAYQVRSDQTPEYRTKRVD